MDTQPNPERRTGPDRRVGERRKDFKSRDRFDELDNRFRRFFIRALIIFVLLGMTDAVALGGFAYTLADRRNEAARIQNQRRQAIMDNCTGQNRRHDNAVSELDTIIGRLAKGSIRQRNAISNRPGTILLINALAPKQDCKAVVRKQVQK